MRNTALLVLHWKDSWIHMLVICVILVLMPGYSQDIIGSVKPYPLWSWLKALDIQFSHVFSCVKAQPSITAKKP